MKYLKLLAVAAILSAFFMACSDNNNPTDGTDVKNYFTMNDGDWWIYENYEVGEAGLDNATLYFDTTKVIKNENYTDKNSVTKMASVLQSKFSDASGTESNYFSTNESQVWTTTDFILPKELDFNLPIDQLYNSWIMLIDDKLNSWTIFDEITITQDGVDIVEGISGDLTAKYKITGKKTSIQTWQGLGKSFSAQEYIITNAIDLSIVPDIIPIPIKTTIDIEVKLLFVDGIGLVQVDVPYQKVSLATFTIPINGSSRKLIDTNKK